METQIPLSLVLSVGTAILSALLGVLFVVSRYAYANDKREAERRISLLETSRDALREQLHSDEVATMRLQGEVNSVKSNHDALSEDVAEIKRTVVTRDLFDAAMQSVRAQLAQILQAMQRYPSSPVGIPRVTTPTSDPPRR